MFRHCLFKPLHLMGEAFAAGAGTKFFWATTRVRDKELSFFICITMLTELSTHGIVGTRYKNLVPLRWTGRFIRVTLTCYCLWLGSRLRPVGSHLKPTWSPLKPTWSPLEAHLKPSVLMVSFNWSPQCLWLGDDWSWLTVLTVNFWCLRLAFLLIFTMKMDAYG